MAMGQNPNRLAPREHPNPHSNRFEKKTRWDPIGFDHHMSIMLLDCIGFDHQKGFDHSHTGAAAHFLLFPPRGRGWLGASAGQIRPVCSSSTSWGGKEFALLGKRFYFVSFLFVGGGRCSFFFSFLLIAFLFLFFFLGGGRGLF